MRRSILTLSLLALASIACAQNQIIQEQLPKVLSGRDARLVTIVPGGMFFHRHDHLLLNGALQVTPEDAFGRSYRRCPECLPPVTTAALSEENTGSTRVLSRYYQTYLRERVDPGAYGAPQGELPAPEKPEQALKAAPGAARPATR